MNIENPFVNCTHPLIDILQKLVDTPCNIPRNERICKNCTNQEIEDETHFLTRCPKFSEERDDLFNSISAKVKNFTNLSDKNKLIWLLNCENQKILNSDGRFLYQNMP